MKFQFSILIVLNGLIVQVVASALSYTRIPSLVKSADIRHFYDAFSGEFILVKGLKGGIPTNGTEFVNNPKADFRYQRLRSFSDVLDSLKIDVSAQSSLLFGRVQIAGAYAYASETSVNKEYQNGIAAFDTEITTELLSLSKKRVINKLDTGLGKMVGATHFVMGVVWGTQSRVHIRWTSTGQANKISNSADIKIGVNAVKYSAEVAMSIGKLKEQLNKNENLEFKAYGNIALQNLSIKSFEEMEDFISKVPEYTAKINGGKGSPIEYILISIEELEKIKIHQTKITSPSSILEGIEDSSTVNTSDMHHLCAEMIFFYEEQKTEISQLKHNLQIITQNKELLSDGIPERAKEQVHIFSTTVSIYHLQMKSILVEARKNTIAAIMKFKLLKEKYITDSMGSFYCKIVRAEQDNHIQKIHEKAWLQQIGMKMMSKTESLERTRIFTQRSSDVAFLLSSDRVKAANKSRWFQNVERMVAFKGVKVFVDCDLAQIRATSCVDKGYIPDEGSIVREFKKFS